MKRTFSRGVHIQIINSSNSCIVATTEDKIEERDSDAAGKEIRRKDKQEKEGGMEGWSDKWRKQSPDFICKLHFILILLLFCGGGRGGGCICKLLVINLQT